MDKLDKKREEILDAAMMCLARYGPLKSTMDDIATVIGMRKASLYYYYRNKEAIFSDALAREADRLNERLVKKMDKLKTAREKIMAMMSSVNEYFRNRAEMLDLNVQAMWDNHALLQKLSRDLKTKNIDLLGQLIREGIDSGEFSEVDEHRVSNAIRKIFDTYRLELYHCLTDRRPDKKEFAIMESESRFVLEIFLNGLKK